MFLEQARRTPGEVALRFEGESVTFEELESLVGPLVQRLHDTRLEARSVVALHGHRSLEWVVGTLGILAAGAAVMPIPSDLPVRRRDEILRFARPDLILTSDPSLFQGEWKRRVLSLDDLGRPGTGASGESRSFQPQVSLDAPAFVLSSSGSTGKPKLIVRSHGSFQHRFRWTWNTHPFGPGDVGCQKAHMTTTHSIYELFEPLLAGAPVVILPDRVVLDLEGFWAELSARKVTRLLLVPSVLRASLEIPGFRPPAFRVVVLMGEYVDPGLARDATEVFDPGTSLYSIYGSTEASSTLVANLRTDWGSGRELPLGKPITPEIVPVVLDPSMKPLEPGAVGRLYMGGPALFSGYLRSPRETREALRHHPGHPRPLYDTRDDVRVTKDGEIEYVGRTDHVVKIRGFRVNTQEVERALRACSGVDEGAVIVGEGPAGSGPVLDAFVRPADVDHASVIEALRAVLPDYMVPSRVVALAEFPRTASGKLDRVRLRGMREGTRRRHDESPPGSDLEGQVRAAFEAVLENPSVDSDRSFFEVGGTSLTVFTLVHRLRVGLGLSREEISAETVYRYPSPRELALHLSSAPEGRSAREDSWIHNVVSLRGGGDPHAPPLFLVSSAGGTLGAYERTVRKLDVRCEVLGIRDPYLTGARDLSEGFPSWIEGYLHTIRARQPQGPYHICAYSSAGAFGYELARRLQHQGEEVALLALVDPLGVDLADRRRFGYWAMWATYHHPLQRAAVRLAGRLRAPFVRLGGLVGGSRMPGEPLSGGSTPESVAVAAAGRKEHVIALSALMELDSGLPLALTDEDLAGATSPDEVLAVLQGRVRTVAPDVDPDLVWRIAVQYGIQVSAQNSYRLEPFDGSILLVEPRSPYAGILADLFRPFVRHVDSRVLPLGHATERVLNLVERFGPLQAHYRSMRDEVFTTALAVTLQSRL